jgi:hypothetical protein
MIWYFPEGVLDTLILAALAGTAVASITLVILLLRDHKKDEVW